VPQAAEEGVILVPKVLNQYLLIAKRINPVQGEYRSQNNSREYKTQREIFLAGNNGYAFNRLRLLFALPFCAHIYTAYHDRNYERNKQLYVMGNEQ
jgi:hypothetical protein